MDNHSLPGIRYVDPGFQQADPAQHRFVASVNHRGIGLVVVNHHNKSIKLAAFTECCNDDVYAELANILPTWSSLLPEGVQGTIIMASTKATLVPGQTENEQEVTSLLNMHFDVQADEKVLVSYLSALDASMVWAVPGKLFSMLNSWKPDAAMRQVGDVITTTDHQKNSDNRSDGHLSVFLDSDTFYVHAYRDGTTQFLNSFQWKTQEELLYFLVAISDKLDMPASNTHLEVMGAPATNDDLPNYLQKVFPKAQYAGSAHTELPHVERPLFHHLVQFTHCES